MSYYDDGYVDELRAEIAKLKRMTLHLTDDEARMVREALDAGDLLAPNDSRQERLIWSALAMLDAKAGEGINLPAPGSLEEAMLVEGIVPIKRISAKEVLRRYGKPSQGGGDK